MQVGIVETVHLHGQAGLGAVGTAPVETTTAQCEAGAVAAAVAGLATPALLIVRDAGGGVADAVLQLAAQRGAVTVSVVAAQFGVQLPIVRVPVLAQALAHAVVDGRALMLRLAHVHRVAALAAAVMVTLQAGQAEVEADATVTLVAAAHAVGAALLP